jgi:hypothetical protein
MIERHYLKCKTCEQPITLRIGLGRNNVQSHTFQCPHCFEDIKLQLKIDYKNISTELIILENCERGTEEGEIINLHPDFAISKDKHNKDFVFPFIDYFSDNRIDQLADFERPSEKLQKETQRSLFLSEEWEDLKRAYSLMLNGKIELAKTITSNSADKFDYDDGLDSVNDWIFRFSYRILNPSKLSLFHNAAEYIRENVALKYQPELKRFKEFYIKNFYEDHLERYFEVYSEFFLHYSEYSQLLIYIKQNDTLPKDYRVSSNDFKHTKMFFGNAYEHLTSNLVILACYNNMANGRPFDKFDKMDLKSYMTIDKAKRTNPFKDTKPFYRFADCLDSTFRNASHHGSVRFNKKKKKIIYRSGGTGAERNMLYTEYLMKCNNLLFSIAALLMIELLLHNSNF